MFYPIYGNNIRVIPDFEQIVLEFELIIVGRLTLFKFIKSIWRIYFDKNIRKVIKLLNKEDTNGRE